ncbi:hypothetical protein T4A_3398 [Trichinella pseudospiralis]|uniref:Uncharacterized protein n=1 Tax=Trichinella pseudospiralis TaxID=6337 RepID=A0A0V1EUZ7_TRIPS|nr:hypothetical protein T4A_3398 [Trichinella pseudospiralis]
MPISLVGAVTDHVHSAVSVPMANDLNAVSPYWICTLHSAISFTQHNELLVNTFTVLVLVLILLVGAAGDHVHSAVSVPMADVVLNMYKRTTSTLTAGKSFSPASMHYGLYFYMQWCAVQLLLPGMDLNTEFTSEVMCIELLYLLFT